MTASGLKTAGGLSEDNPVYMGYQAQRRGPPHCPCGKPDKNTCLLIAVFVNLILTVGVAAIGLYLVIIGE